jgi:uncharacterized paraquat-inducible protein A
LSAGFRSLEEVYILLTISATKSCKSCHKKLKMYRQLALYATWAYLVFNQMFLGRELREIQALVYEFAE